ncbi:MAG: NAD(P)-dependent oxidoreductase, partial [Oceanobacter sp.]
MLGFIGLGLMGKPMVLRLLAAGYQVAVWNRSACKAQPLIDAGATWAATPQALVDVSDVVISCVTDTSAVEQVVFGEQGLHLSKGEGKILVDCSSIDPEATRQMASRLRKANGMSWVDCPVSGGVAGAEQGTLAMMAGGTAEDLKRIEPIMMNLGQRLTHMGPVGSGQVTKICNQILVSCNVQVMAEVIALAENAGVDAGMIPSALKGGFADSIP